MDIIILIILISVSGILILALFGFFAYLFIDRYFIKPNYMKVVIMCADKKVRPVAAKKLKEEKNVDGKIYSACEHKGKTFFYLPKNVRQIGNMNGFFCYEKNCIALDISDDKFEDASRAALHPVIMTDILNSKLLSELLRPEVTLELILIIAMLVISIIGFIGLFYIGVKILQSLPGIESKLDIIIEGLKTIKVVKTG
jgi:hypothetical protein